MKYIIKIRKFLWNFHHFGSHRTKIVICVSVIALSTIIAVPILYVNSLIDKINYTDWSDTVKVEDMFEEDMVPSQFKTMQPEDVSWQVNLVTTNQSERNKDIEGIYNFLVVGEEAINTKGNGRTDSMMIVTLDTVNNAIKLTSLMRDIYVKIPEHKDNRLNAAYSMGGMPLLVRTIESNFGIKITNSAKVDFSSFETIIDKLGGVEISITSDEAKYLNSTNYISDPCNRNIKEGKQTLNGNQVLGYARVRYVRSENGEQNDFGRTNRQRTILDAIFKKYKTKSPSELIESLKDILPLVTTDMNKKEIVSYAMILFNHMPNSLSTLRLPIDNSYTGVSIRNMSVLAINWGQNQQVLTSFIYGFESTDRNHVYESPIK
ncbi:MAG: LCP family protein [Mobilitalea sp.]